MVSKILEKKKKIEIEYKGKYYNCYDYEKSISPMRYKFSGTVYDGKNYIIAKIEDDNGIHLAMRWNIASSEYETHANKKDKTCTGYPNTRGYPTWFILPDSFLDDLQQYILKNKDK